MGQHIVGSKEDDNVAPATDERGEKARVVAILSRRSVSFALVLFLVAASFLLDGQCSNHDLKTKRETIIEPPSSFIPLSSNFNTSRRSLRSWFSIFASSAFADPKSVAPRVSRSETVTTTTTSSSSSVVTIYVTRDIFDDARVRRQDKLKANPAASIFKTDFLYRYGTGRVTEYIVKEHAECDMDCLTYGMGIQGPPQIPCLAVVRTNKTMRCDMDLLSCNYPMCKTMLSNDEMCTNFEYVTDARQYYTADMAHLGYLPIGMRSDAWQSLQTLERVLNQQFSKKVPSKRSYAFNAIFSINTNSIRYQLAEDIEARGDTRQLPVYIHMTERLMNSKRQSRRHPERKHSHDRDQLKTDKYMEVLLDSIFTLSPAGHSPESFRIYEAVEAGSIPILSRDDLYGTRHPNPRNRDSFVNETHPCKEALHHWYDAPVVVLESWEELYPAVERLLEDPRGLEERQRDLMSWYDERMRGIVARFEDMMLGSG